MRNAQEIREQNKTEGETSTLGPACPGCGRCENCSGKCPEPVVFIEKENGAAILLRDDFSDSAKGFILLPADEDGKIRADFILHTLQPDPIIYGWWVVDGEFIYPVEGEDPLHDGWGKEYQVEGKTFRGTFRLFPGKTRGERFSLAHQWAEEKLKRFGE